MPATTRSRAPRAPGATGPSAGAPLNTAAMPSSSRSNAQRPQLMHRPTSQIVVDQRLSFELMRIVITTNFSHIFRRREVFGRDFVWKSNTTIDPADPTTLTYDEFIAAAESNKRNRGKPVDWERTPDLYNFKILSRGQNAAADKVLDWLETGVKDALEKEFLSKLELCFHRDDPNDASDAHLIESYAMVFTYASEGGVSQVFSNDSTARNSIVLQDARQDAKNLLDTLEQELAARMKYQERLPKGVHITMNMIFNDKCSDDWQPKGFIPSEKHNPRLAGLGQGAWVMSMATKFHGISVHLLPETSTLIEKSRQGSLQQVRASGPLEESSRTQDSPRTMPSSSPDSDNRTAAPAGIANDHSNPMSQGGSVRHVNRIHTQGSGTQPEVMAMLSRMGLSRNPNADTQDTVILHGPSTHNLEANFTAVQTPRHRQPTDRPRRYKGFVCRRIDKAPEHVFGSEIKCECGVATDETNLMRCNICGHFQHGQCYGYCEVNAQNVEFVCYSCLLRDKPTVLSTLTTCCTHRRLLYHLKCNGGDSLEELAKVLDCDRDTTRGILGQLKEVVQGPQRPTRKSSSQKTTQPKYILVDGQEKLHESYFNPDLHIEDYVELPHVLSREAPTTATSFEVESMQHSPIPKMRQRRGPVDGSSTQGTPSTVQRWTPETSQLPHSAFSGEFGSRSRKRGNLAALENDATKRFKEWSTRSPNVADRTY